ncbi:unnamed protein product, partial [Meganyctiphanes norvegica]
MNGYFLKLMEQHGSWQGSGENASRECPTCCNEYNDGDHRVRVLSCGHSQCTSCVRAQYSLGKITCAACRRIHAYINWTSIPINYIAEKMKEVIDNLKEENILVPKLHKGMCAEHSAYKLFWCNTHNEWICPHCFITSHPKGDCCVIPIGEKLTKFKELMISNLYQEIKHFDNTEREVTLSMVKVSKQAEIKTGQVKKAKEEIENLKKSISRKEKEISVLNAKQKNLNVIANQCNKKKCELEGVMTRLHGVSSFKELDLEDKKITSIISDRYETWRKEVKEKKELSLFGNITTLVPLKPLVYITLIHRQLRINLGRLHIRLNGLPSFMIFLNGCPHGGWKYQPFDHFSQFDQLNQR